MPDFLNMLLLADGAVLELNWPAIAGVITTILTGAGAGARVLWGYFTKREEEKRKGWKEVVDAKDALIAQKDAALAKAQADAAAALKALRLEKDEQVEALSKKLSTKSDEHAAKIQELMQLALSKVESMGDKNEALLDRALKVMAEFTQELRRIAGEGSDAGSISP